MQDSPDDEKPETDEHAEFPDDVDVIEEPPGEEDNSDEFDETDIVDVVEQSNDKDEGDIEGGRLSSYASMVNFSLSKISLLLLQEDRRSLDNDIVVWSTES